MTKLKLTFFLCVGILIFSESHLRAEEPLDWGSLAPMKIKISRLTVEVESLSHLIAEKERAEQALKAEAETLKAAVPQGVRGGSMAGYFANQQDEFYAMKADEKYKSASLELNRLREQQSKLVQDLKSAKIEARLAHKKASEQGFMARAMAGFLLGSEINSDEKLSRIEGGGETANYFGP